MQASGRGETLKGIYCDTARAFDVLMAQSDALAKITNPLSSEQWRIVFDDCIAVGYRDCVLPQGKNPQRVKDLLADKEKTDDEPKDDD
jgi:hypothetical protein